MKRWKNVTAGCTSAATAIAVNAHVMTRLRRGRSSSTSTVTAKPRRIANADRAKRTSGPDLPDALCAAWSAPSDIDSYDNHVADETPGSSAVTAQVAAPREPVHEFARSTSIHALPSPSRCVPHTRGDRLVRAFRPRTLTALAVGTLLALALNPLVEALQRRTSWLRRYAPAPCSRCSHCCSDSASPW